MKLTGSYHRAKKRCRLATTLLFAIFVSTWLGAHSTSIAQTDDDDESSEEIFEPDETIFEPDEEEGDTATPKGISEFSLGQGKPPPGYENVEVIDHTIGFRDDYFSAVNFGVGGTLWVSTFQGRVYRSDDGGANWYEFTVLPEVKQLWGFSSQYVLLGHLRNPKVNTPNPIALAPSGGIGVQSGSYSLLNGNAHAARQGDSGAGQGGYSLDGTPSFRQSGGFSNPLQGTSMAAAGSAGIVLGAGLSNRAPRLSLLLTVLKRPTANISMQRLLFTTAYRNTIIREITQHPTDPEKIFAATAFGLYKSGDSGKSWYRDFAGMTPAERWIGHVVADPNNPKRVYMGTSRGLFVSDDSGDNWSKNTKVPEISIRRVVIDPTDSRYVYVAGWGGVYRSDDYGANFNFAFYHSIPKRRDVLWMSIDPFDPNVAYLGTADGLMRTTKLRTSTISDWKVVNGLRTVNLTISTLAMCTKHPGHIYMQTQSGLPTINYVANGPENLLHESWDHGKSWRELAGNRTQGDIRWFTLDPKDPDTIWVAFSRAIVQVKRVPDKANKEVDLSTAPLTMGRPVLPEMPSLSEIVRAGLVYNELEMDEFVDRLDSLRHRNWLPNKLNLGFNYNLWNIGGSVKDIQFNDFRFLNVQKHSSWNVSAWMSWALPDFLYRQDSAPLMRFQELKMVNGVRETLMNTLHRHYGELQRIIIRQRYKKNEPLKTRVNLALRAEYLKTVVDLATGDYLSKWKKKANK